MASDARVMLLQGRLLDAPRAASAIGLRGGELVTIEDPTEVVSVLDHARRRGAPFRLLLVDTSNERVRAAVLLRMVTQRYGEIASVVLAERGEDEEMRSALSSGADDFLVGPVDERELGLRCQRLLGSAAGRGRPQRKRKPRKSDVLIGGAEWIKGLYERISMVAPTDVSVAISGESGTGKELVARTIHRLSNRFEQPFVVVNCAAIPEALLEDELFGHVRGAFTDASRDREGLFAAAHKGTLFLDEIGEMSLPLQAKLLRVLQTSEFRPIGSDVDQKVDIRLLTATNKRLEALVERGDFREDLYYRIQVFPMELVPLRERREDIPLLAQHFLLLHRSKVGKSVEGFSTEALERLSSFDYPGNVRELENKIYHALVLASGETIEVEDIPGSRRASPALEGALDLDLGFKVLKREAVGRFERRFIRELLERHEGNLAAASRQAKVDRKNLWALCKKYDIDIAAIRAKKKGQHEAGPDESTVVDGS